MRRALGLVLAPEGSKVTLEGSKVLWKTLALRPGPGRPSKKIRVFHSHFHSILRSCKARGPGQGGKGPFVLRGLLPARLDAARACGAVFRSR